MGRHHRYQETRAVENRVAETRDQTQQELGDSGFQGDLYVDRTKKPEHVEYRWVRYALRGDSSADSARLSRLVNSGWRPVPASRHPELQNTMIEGLITDQGDIIKRGGLVLMELPKIEYHRRERAKQLDSEEQLAAADRLQPRDNKTPVLHGSSPSQFGHGYAFKD